MTKTAETKIGMRRVADALVPATDQARYQLFSIPAGDLVTVVIKQDRSRKQQAYYWGLISLVWQNLDNRVFPKPENFHNSLKAMLGEYDEVWIPETGERVLKLRSTSFAKMNGADFAVYLDRVIDLIIQHWMPTTKRNDILREVSQMVGITYNEVTKKEVVTK